MRLAESAPGFIWRWADDGGQVAGGAYDGIAGDPFLAASLSVWSDVGALRDYVYRSLHGDFFRRRAAWFTPMPGPTYVLWPCAATDRPTVAEGLARLDRLRQDGPGPQVQDFPAALRQSLGERD